MFNPTNFDDACVQSTHIESKVKSVYDVPSTKAKKAKKGKGKGKGKHETTMKKGEERPTCLHCQKKQHGEEKCWVLHSKLKLKWFKDQKGKKKATIIIEDLGLDSKDETKIAIVGVKGKAIVGNDSNIASPCDSSSKYHLSSKDKNNALFHIRVITKQTKIDTLIDNGSQAKLI